MGADRFEPSTDERARTLSVSRCERVEYLLILYDDALCDRVSCASRVSRLEDEAQCLKLGRKRAVVRGVDQSSMKLHGDFREFKCRRQRQLLRCHFAQFS